MLEEPPYELPARASAMAGASARFALKKSARRMRQFSSRVTRARAAGFRARAENPDAAGGISGLTDPLLK
jgi:hypothetical protein